MCERQVMGITIVLETALLFLCEHSRVNEDGAVTIGDDIRTLAERVKVESMDIHFGSRGVEG